jgi:hypothetical protein
LAGGRGLAAAGAADVAAVAGGAAGARGGGGGSGEAACAGGDKVGAGGSGDGAVAGGLGSGDVGDSDATGVWTGDDVGDESHGTVNDTTGTPAYCPDVFICDVRGCCCRYCCGCSCGCGCGRGAGIGGDGCPPAAAMDAVKAAMAAAGSRVGGECPGTAAVVGLSHVLVLFHVSM